MELTIYNLQLTIKFPFLYKMTLGAIAAGHSESLATAEEILKAGGNAFDAAIAATFTMFATEPCMASAGAGGFAMCHSAENGTRLLDFFTQTPGEKNINRDLDFKAIEVDFGTETEIFHVGKASVATPGVIAGLFEMHKNYGTIPIKVLVQQAQHIAKRGVVVDEFGEIDLNLLQSIFAIEPSVRDIFFNENGIKKLGNNMVYPHLPDFLEFIAEEGCRGFYKGEIAEKISKDIFEGGGFLTRSDFENYRVRWSQPMRMPYRDKTLCLPNGPSLGGAIISLLHHHATNDHLPITARLLQVKEEIHERWALKKAMDELLPNLNFNYQGSTMASKGTSHISIVDKNQNAVALTVSIGEGSGYWIPGTDMQMNNMLGESFLIPDGHHSWTTDTRMNSMMTPVMVLDDNEQIAYAGGSGGAGRIPYVIYQVLEALYKNGLSLEEATLFPRQHWHEGVLHYEEGAKLTQLEIGRSLKEWDEHSLFFGGVHSVLRNSKGSYEACGDPRRYGVGKVLI